LQKEIRELDPVLMKQAVETLGFFRTISVLDGSGARALDTVAAELVLPDEDVSHELAQRYFPKAKVLFDQIFLRWDKHNAQKEKESVPDKKITRDEFARRLMAALGEEAARSSDIWRHVAAAVVKDGEVVLIRHNEHQPSQHSPYVHGDPRSNFHRGDRMELSTALHAEAGLVAEAARKGIPLEGADMYVTVYPCPVCARLVAFSGVKNLYVGGGNPVLDAEDVLKNKGVTIAFVE
jgi:dCMP deaminase